MSQSLITVVSLGPGSRDLITLGTLDAVKKAGSLFLRTALTDAGKYLAQLGLSFESFDDLHDSCYDFDELDAAITARLLHAAEKGPVCYAVLDAVSDSSVQALLKKASCRVLPGVPVSSPFLSARPSQDVLIQYASQLNLTDTQHDLLIAQLDNAHLAGMCKLQLLKFYAPEKKLLFFPPSEKEPRPYSLLSLEDLDRQKKYGHTCAVLIPAEDTQKKQRFDVHDLEKIMHILRAPGGCPWDGKQTHLSLRPYLIEESYEAAAAIDEDDTDHLADELGDVLLQIVFHADIGQATGEFDMQDIATYICKKMLRRHPHVFGNTHCDTPQQVVAAWDQIKKAERNEKLFGELMSDIPAGMEPLLRAHKAQKKARDVGFDWDDPADALQKVHEEAEEVLEASRENDPDHLEEELGDLFFSCVNVCRLYGMDSQKALARATDKFIRRFCAMEKAIILDGKRLQGLTLSEMDVYWNGCKREGGCSN